MALKIFFNKRASEEFFGEKPNLRLKVAEEALYMFPTTTNGVDVIPLDSRRGGREILINGTADLRFLNDCALFQLESDKSGWIKIIPSETKKSAYGRIYNFKTILQKVPRRKLAAIA